MLREKSPKKHSTKWIRNYKRVAIVVSRDGQTCPYCGRNVKAHDVKLTLDHITPKIYRGSNRADNLITACHECNSKRKDKTVVQFLRDMGYDESTVAEIVLVINRQRRQRVNVQAGKDLLKEHTVASLTGH